MGAIIFKFSNVIKKLIVSCICELQRYAKSAELLLWLLVSILKSVVFYPAYYFKYYCMKRFLKENSLSIIFLGLFFVAFAGQMATGYMEYLAELEDVAANKITFWQYLKSGHFAQATFENWESEFLQMALFVVLTVSLSQKGSSESKSLEGKDKTDKEPNPKRKGAPWPVRKGGLILKLYETSLSLSLFILFALSWILHFYGSIRDENVFRQVRSQPTVTIMQHLGDSRFWFESFQNWQSEFLSVFAIVVLSIYLRQKGSSQSKQIDAPYDETGD